MGRGRIGTAAATGAGAGGGRAGGITRRGVALGLPLLGLAACVGSGGSGARAAGGAPAMAFAADPGFDAWVAGFRPRAAAKGIPPAVIEAAFRDAGFLPGVIERDRAQTEFTRTLEDYLAIAASDERIAKGRAALARERATLDAIAARHGVEPQVVAAVWGVESQYGERRGEVPVISALATLAYEGRRGAFFEDQLVAALKILAAGDVTPARMTGSWAGAMGHTQFMPTSYLAFAVDHTGDGRRDIWGENPADALASTAAYLARSGWVRGQPWGIEVTRPAGLAAPGRGSPRAVAEWQAAGVRPADGGARLPDHGPAALAAPAGPAGPAFLLFRNFSVILRYNNAENYAYGVGHLADRLAGGGPIRAAFPPDAAGLTQAERRRIQERLTARGHDTGGTDGVLGARSRAAIAAFQRAQGLPATGEPSRALLDLLG